MQESNQSNIAQFHQEMIASFSLEELRTLCLEIEVNYDTLGGEELGGKARELIIRMAHNGRLPDLQNAVEEKRKHINWPDIRNAQLPSDWEASAWNKKWIVRAIIAVLFIATLFFSASKLLPQPLVILDPAADDEALIVILPFHLSASGSSETHQLIYDAVEERRQELGLDNMRVKIEPRTVLQLTEREAAQALGERYGAAVVIWGAESRTSVKVNFLNIKEPEMDVGNEQVQVIAPDTLVGAQFIEGHLPGQLAFLSFFVVGQAMVAEGKLAEAIPILEEAVANISEELIAEELASPKAAADAYFWLGWLHQTSDNLEQAIADYTKAIDLNPDYALAYRNRGLAYYHLDNLEQAIADYTKAIDLSPDFAKTYNNRGIAYKNSDNLEQAIVDLEQYLELFPNASNREAVLDTIEQIKTELGE